MIKTKRISSYSDDVTQKLEQTLNDIVNAGNVIMFVVSEYLGLGETGYTIIYQTPNKEENNNEKQNETM